MSRTIRRKGLLKHLGRGGVDRIRFHMDLSTRYYTDYSRASWWYRNVRNRQLRLRHKRVLCYAYQGTAVDENRLELPPFVHNAGWDQW